MLGHGRDLGEPSQSSLLQGKWHSRGRQLACRTTMGPGAPPWASSATRYLDPKPLKAGLSLQMEAAFDTGVIYGC